MLKVEGISKRYKDFAVENISFNVAPNDYLMIMGPSGAGKSLVLEMIAGVILPDRGRVLLKGSDITYRAIQKRKIGLVYQDRALFPHLTVQRNIEYGLRSLNLSTAQIKEKVEEIATQVKIKHLLLRFPKNLSGGEIQRVALARTVVMRPELILLDEPLSSLEQDSRRELATLLKQLNMHGHTFIHVTHDFQKIEDLATHTIYIEGGHLISYNKVNTTIREN